MMRPSIIWVIGVFAFGLISGVASGADTKNGKSTFLGGASFTGGSNENLSITSGSSLGTVSTQANTSVLLGGEISYQPIFLGGALYTQVTRYTAKSGGSDGELGFFFMPRLAGNIGWAELWTGVGVGMVMTNEGQKTQVVNGVTMTMTNTPVGFAWNPRAGIDFSVGKDAFFGFEGDYVSTKGTATATATQSGVTLNLSDNFTRHWFVGAFRVGSTF